MKPIITPALLFIVCSPLLFGTVQAQHDHKNMPSMDKAMPKNPARANPDLSRQDTMKMSAMMHGMPMGQIDSTMMTHQLSRNLPMSRNGSGTSWVPDNSPVYAYMQHAKQADSWKLMYMGNVYVRYTNQDFTRQGSRGGTQIDAPNWFMAMAQKPIGTKGLFAFNAMLSLDAIGVSPAGYPLLFQSGEAYNNKPLVDRQHPHDLFANLSVSYAHSFTKDIDLYGLVGYPAEPVIGPPVFMHRISAFNMPEAGIGHHWQDATHITFGVATLGFRYKDVKIEGSTFTGREPDEFRYNFDKVNLDSWAWRVSYNPTKSLALQYSQGAINSPEVLSPDENIFRHSASIIHTSLLGPDAYIATSAVWGLNQKTGHGSSSDDNSALLESNLQWQKWAVFGRCEWVQKLPEELALDFPDHKKLQFSTLSLGTNYIVYSAYRTDLRVGGVCTVNLPDADVRNLYGDLPLSLQVYIKLTPAMMVMRH